MGLKKEEFNSEAIRSVNKVITVLKYLNQGRSLTLGENGWKIRLAETSTGGFKFVMKGSQTNSLNDEEVTVWLGLEMSMASFSEYCNEFSEEEIASLQADISLKEIKKCNKNWNK